MFYFNVVSNVFHYKTGLFLFTILSTKFSLCVASKAYNMFLCYIAGKRINTHDVVHDGSKNVEC